MATEFLPLEGVRVVDVTSSLAGPYCTEILAALGASVVKVEHPERGDEARAWGPAFWEGASVMFYAANLSKRSLINCRSDELDFVARRPRYTALASNRSMLMPSLASSLARYMTSVDDALGA